MLSEDYGLIRAGRSGDRILVWASLFALAQTGRGVHPTSCTMATGSFSGVNWSGYGIDHSLPI